MGIADFFRFGRSRNKPEQNDLTQKEKERLYALRQGIANEISSEQEKQVAVSDIHDFAGIGDFTGMVDVYSKYVYNTSRDKGMRLEVYREMAKYPEIAFAVDEYVDEAMQYDDEGKFLNLTIKNTALEDETHENTRKTLIAEFNNLFFDVIEIESYFDQWFREYMVDAEIFFEKIFDIDNPEYGITRVKKLLTEDCFPVWENPKESDQVLFFGYRKESEVLNIHKELIAYANSGIFEYDKNGDERRVLSFLEPARTTYKRLKLLEDAMVIYRLTRAPERRVFKIDVGNLPKGRAEQFMKEMMTKYRQRKMFDPKTGDVTEGIDTMAMTEDFWFPVFQGGRSSEVTSLPGGQNLGDIEDVEYFLDKLYRGLKIPKSRFGEDNRFSIGDTNSEISREEMKFMKEVERYTRRFANALKDIFFTHLKLKGIVDEYGLSEHDIGLKVNENNLFKRFWEAKILEIKFQNFEKFAGNMDTDEPIFAKEMVLKKYLEWGDDIYNKNEELLAAEKAARKAEEAEEEEAGGDDDFGGMDDESEEEGDL